MADSVREIPLSGFGSSQLKQGISVCLQLPYLTLDLSWPRSYPLKSLQKYLATVLVCFVFFYLLSVSD